MGSNRNRISEILEKLAEDEVQEKLMYEDEEYIPVRTRFNLPEKSLAILDGIAESMEISVGEVLDEYFSDGGFNVYALGEFKSSFISKTKKSVTKTITISKITRDDINKFSKILQIPRDQYLEYGLDLLLKKIKRGRRTGERLVIKTGEAMDRIQEELASISKELIRVEHPYLNQLRYIIVRVGSEMYSLTNEFFEHWDEKCSEPVGEDEISQEYENSNKRNSPQR